MKHLDIRITGRVQEVFFRSAAEQKAGKIGIAGLVRNEPDGSVYAEVEGDEDDLETFLAWLRKGPPGASVDEVARGRRGQKLHRLRSPPLASPANGQLPVTSAVPARHEYLSTVAGRTAFADGFRGQVVFRLPFRL